MTQDNCLDSVENSANSNYKTDVTKETENGTTMCATEYHLGKVVLILFTLNAHFLT